MVNIKQLQFDLQCGVTKEQACIMCHLSSECSGCCVKCRAENKNNDCSVQSCSLLSMEHDGNRWNTWMYLVATSLPRLKKFVPHKYWRAINRIKQNYNK